MTMTKNKRTVEDLIAEMEGLPPAAGGPPQSKLPSSQARIPAAASPDFFGRWLPAVVLLALGFGAGWSAAGLRQPVDGAASTNPGKETRQKLLASGWQESDQGVFTRRCQDNCR
jgi:hypothetical protein